MEFYLPQSLRSPRHSMKHRPAAFWGLTEQAQCWAGTALQQAF